MSVTRVLVLAALWCVLTRELSVANVALGLALGAALVGWLGKDQAAGADRSGVSRSRSALLLGRRALRRPWPALELAIWFLWQLVRSNLRVALIVLRPRLSLRPLIVAVPTETETDEELAIVSDLVTLTPGTLTLDVDDDGQILIVHVLSGDDAESVREEIANGLARRVRRLFA